GGHRLLGEVAVSRGAAARDEHLLHPAQGAAPDQPRPVAVVAQHTLAAAGEDAAGAAHGLDQGPPPAPGPGPRPLPVDVLAGPAGLDGLNGVPVVGGADEDGVEVAAGEQVAEVVVGGAVTVAVAAVDEGPGALAVRRHGVADGDHLHLGEAHKALHVA